MGDAMSLLWTDMAVWWLRLAVAGGLLLLAGAALVIACRRPAIRLRTASWVFAVALLVVPLTFLPGWLKLPWSLPASTNLTVASETKAKPQPSPPSIEEPSRTASNAPTDDVDVFAPLDDGTAEPVAAAAPPVASSSHSVQSEATPAPAGNRSYRGWIANSLLVGYWTIVLALLGRLAIGQ